MHPNSNLSSISMFVRDHERKFLWGVMGPLKGMERV